MCDSCAWERRVELIDDLLEEERAQFAHDTLEDIREWVVENQHITGRQIGAIENIAESVGL